MRNMMQTIQTTYPVAGEKYTGKAIKYGIKWLKDEKLQEEMIQRGVIPRDALSQNFGDIQDFIANAEAGRGGVLGKGLVTFLRKGTSWYKSTDDFNRIVAYQAQYMRAMDEGAKVLSGKIDFEKFLRTSKLDLQDEKNGPLTKLVTRLLVEQRNPEAAAHAIADNFQRMSQFQYSRENAARILQSTPGRLFGQYGTWSASYLEFLRGVKNRGSWENKAKVVSRWIGANAAVYYGASELFGVDAARWVFFSPLSYTGGPAVGIAQNAAAVGTMAVQGKLDLEKSWEQGTFAGTNDVDAVTRMQGGRLTKAPTQFIPGFGAGRDVYKAVQEEEFGEAVKRFLNMPSTKGASGAPLGVTLK
jgi:hypothetical protein